MRDFWIGAIVGLAVGVLVGIAWQDAYCIIKTALKNPNRKRYSMGKIKIQVWMVVLLFAFVQTITGVGIIVQYGRLTGFIDCQARYNQTSSQTRDERLPASAKQNDALFDVLEAVRDGDQAKINRRIDRALEAQQKYIDAQRANPYVSPEDTCGEAGEAGE